MTDEQKKEPKKYLYEPSGEDIKKVSRKIRVERVRDVRKSTYVPKIEENKRTYKLRGIPRQLPE